jgi:hypothetical protein
VGMGSLVHIIVFYIYVLIKFIIHIYVLIPHIYILCFIIYIYTTLYILIYNINYTIYIYLYWFGQCISECHLGRNFMLDLWEVICRNGNCSATDPVMQLFYWKGWFASRFRWSNFRNSTKWWLDSGMMVGLDWAFEIFWLS